VAPIDDTMLLSYVLEGGLHGHGMDELAQLHLDYQTIKFKDVAGSGKNQITFDKVPLDKALDYAAEDADITCACFEVLKPRLVTDRLTTVYETIERPLVPVLAEMELTGIKVDRDTLRRMSNDFATRIGELEDEIHKLAGREFNHRLAQAAGRDPVRRDGLDGGKKGKTGAYATGADVLEDARRPGPRPARPGARLAPADQAEEHLHRRPGRTRSTRAHRPRPHLLLAGRRLHRPAQLQRSQPAEHPVRTEEGRKIRTAFVAEKGHAALASTIRRSSCG
jgi:DNA polymerase I